MKIKNIASIIFCYLFICGQVIAQTAAILPEGKTQFLDNNGNPLSSGKVDFFIPSTTTRKTTWQDAAKTIANANPVVLDAGGRAIIYGDGSYRQIVKNSANTTIYDAVTASNGTGGNTPTAFGDGAAVGSIKPWAGLTLPNNYVYAFGQELSRTTYSVLFSTVTLTQNLSCSSGGPILTGLSDTSQIPTGAVLESTCIAAGSIVLSKTSTTVTMNNNASLTTNTTGVFFLYGNGNGSTTFNVPDLRGYVIAGRCNMGGTDCINLTSVGLGTNSSATGARGGVQTRTLGIPNLPPYTPTGFNGTILATGTINTPVITIGGAGTVAVNAAAVGSGANLTGGGGALNQGAVTATSSALTFTGTPATGPNWVGNAQGGTSSPVPTVQPTFTLNYIIKILPDISLSSTNVVTSLGSMVGDITCGTWLVCSSQNIAVSISAPAATLLGNVSSSIANASLFTIQGLTLQGSPDPSNDFVPIYHAATGTIQKVTPATLGSTGLTGVSSIGGSVGAITVGAGLSMAGNTLLNTGILSIGGVAGTVTLDSNLSIPGNILTANVRPRVLTSRSYWIRKATGNDSFCTGLVDAAYVSGAFPQACAFATWQKADDVASGLDFNGQQITYQHSCADGVQTFTVGTTINAKTGGGTLQISGCVTIGNTLFNVVGADIFKIVRTGQTGVNFDNMQFTGGDLGQLHVLYDSTINVGSGVYFGVAPTAQIWIHDRQAVAQFLGSAYKINGGAAYHIFINGGFVFHESCTITISGTPNFSGAFVSAINGGAMQLVNFFAGGGATGARYNSASNSVINSFGQGVNILPGNVAGNPVPPANNTGGQYIP